MNKQENKTDLHQDIKNVMLQKIILETVIPYFLMIVIGITMVAPFIWMVTTSLKEQGAVFVYPPEWIPKTQIMADYEGTRYNVLTASVDGSKKYFIREQTYKKVTPVTNFITRTKMTVSTNAVSMATVREINSYDGIYRPIVREKGKDVKGDTHYFQSPVFSDTIREMKYDALDSHKVVYFRWRNYYEAWTAVPFARFFLNSVIVATIVTLGQVLTSSFAAFAFARLEFPGRDKLFLGYLATMMIPGQVTMIPVFILLKKLNWIDSYKALILPMMFTAYGTFMLRQFFLTIPKDLEDAAVIDGCGKLRIWATIIMPLSKAALATLTTFTFMGTWNNFLWPLIVTNKITMKTLPVGLQAFQGQYNTNWTLLMAASLIVLAPVLILYIFNQRFFTKGIVLSGLKG